MVAGVPLYGVVAAASLKIVPAGPVHTPCAKFGAVYVINNSAAVTLPTSPAPKSATRMFQVPLMVLNKAAHVEFVVTILPKLGLVISHLSAAKLPVLGAGAPLIGVVETESIVVLVKLAVPLLPDALSNKANMLKEVLFGACKFITTSPTQVCGKVNLIPIF